MNELLLAIALLSFGGGVLGGVLAAGIFKQGPRGPEGPRGPLGPPGPMGATGAGVSTMLLQNTVRQEVLRQMREAAQQIQEAKVSEPGSQKIIP